MGSWGTSALWSPLFTSHGEVNKKKGNLCCSQLTVLQSLVPPDPEAEAFTGGNGQASKVKEGPKRQGSSPYDCSLGCRHHY